MFWSFGLIVSVHKKDNPSKVENYQGITLLSSLSKLFTSILNNRLYDYATKREFGKMNKVALGKCMVQLIWFDRVSKHLSGD